MAFTSEIMPTYNVAVTLPPKPAPATLEELRREKVGVVRGAAPADEHLANVRKSASWNLLLVKYFGERAPLVLGRRR